MKLNTNDTFIVISKTILNLEDRKILSMLYQPIISSQAISLYFTLWSYLDRNELVTAEILHKQLVINMGMSIKEIDDNKKKLEAIGLIKTYYKEGSVDSYVYELYSPLSAYQFFNDSVLGSLLLNITGKYEYERILNYFKVPKVSLSGYKDVTHKFNDVFEFMSVNVIDNLNDNIKNRTTNGITYNSLIDVDNVLELVGDDYLNIKSVTRDMRDLIKKVSLLYGFDESIMVELIRNSINEKKAIDNILLRNNASSYYRFENNNGVPRIVLKNSSSINDTSKKGKLINTFESTSNYDFLVSKYNGGMPSKTDLKLLDYLAFDLKLNNGVINVLIDYVLKVNKNRLTRSYVETIAGTWKRNNITTAKEAIEFATNEYKNKRKKKEVIKDKPEWFDKEIDKAEATSEEFSEIDDILNSFK